MSLKRGKLVVISGPSGSGKSTVIEHVMRHQPEFVFSVSATTRQKRTHEIDGREYHFITRTEFERMITDDEFFEWAQYVGNYYGTPKIPIEQSLSDGKTVILDIEVQGARQVIKKAPYAISIFMVPPNLDALEKRLRGRRTNTEQELAARLERAKTELQNKDMYDYIVVNDEPKRAAKEILQIIRACSVSPN